MHTEPVLESINVAESNEIFIEEQQPLVGDVLLKLSPFPPSEITRPNTIKDKNLIGFLTQLQNQSVLGESKPSESLPVVDFIHYKGILKQASVREHLIERVVKVMLKTAEAGFTFPGLPGVQFQSDSENDTVDPVVKQCGDKSVTKLFRRYGIYKIYPYNKTKTELDFIIITAQKALYVVSLQRRQKIPLTKGFKEVKLSLEDAVGLLLASIITHHKTHDHLQNADILPSEQ